MSLLSTTGPQGYRLRAGRRRERPVAPASRRPDDLDERQVRRLALAGALVLVLILVIIFVVQNSGSVKVSFVFFSARISLIWVIVLSAVLGGAVALIVARLVRRRFSRDEPPPG